MAKKLPPDQEELWNSFTKNIKPLKHNKIIPQSPSVKVLPEKPLLPIPSVRRTQAVETLHPNDLKKVRIDAKLDLHGFTQTLGENAVREFLKTASYKGLRWVCIITGKGSPNNPSVLREQTPKWLKSMPEYVTGYAHAKPDDGGTGALYVKIRKKVHSL